MAAVCLLAQAPAAQAAWYRAETDRFVVFGEGQEAQVRDYAVKLTTFDRVLRLLNPIGAERPVGGKVEVYLVRGLGEMRRVRPSIGAGIAGFYSGNNEAMFAVADVDREGLKAQQVLFHEYAHHFMLANFPAAYPAWFVEGWAEYYQTVEITPDQIKVGDYSDNRVEWLWLGRWLPLDELLTKRVSDLRDEGQAAFYAQAWLLMHYMRSDPERAAQLNAAMLAISKGEEPLTAFKAATGAEPKQLDKRLQRYRKLPVLLMKNSEPSPEVTVTQLPASADDLLLENLRLMSSPLEPVDTRLLEQIRAKAARYPGERLAEMTLARAEFIYGDVGKAQAILDARIAMDPKDEDALVLAGVGQHIAGLRDPARMAERFRAARRYFGKAHTLDSNDFRTLYHYARSRQLEANYPTDNDVAALLQARAFAPSVLEISMHAGAALMHRGRKAEAALVLSPLLNSPHGGSTAQVAKALLEGRSLDAAEASAQPAAGPVSAPSGAETEKSADGG
jgi:tetratricopeptide (TPR) repeat protein